MSWWQTWFTIITIFCFIPDSGNALYTLTPYSTGSGQCNIDLFCLVKCGAIVPEVEQLPTFAWTDRCSADACIEIDFSDGTTDLIGANEVSDQIYVGHLLSTKSQASIVLLGEADRDIVLIISSPKSGLCNMSIVDMDGTGKASCFEEDCLSQCMKNTPDGLEFCVRQCLGYHGGFP